jgi:hypothetical protein
MAMKDVRGKDVASRFFKEFAPVLQEHGSFRLTFQSAPVNLEAKRGWKMGGWPEAQALYK